MKKIKLLSIMMSLSVALGSVSPVFAYTLDENGNSVENVSYKDVKETGDFETSVFAELASNYKITIPKTVVLSGAKKQANYFVRVEGDIAGYEEIEVVPDESFYLYTKAKDAQEAVIEQDKVVWTVDDFDTDANGLIDAPTITAGKWTGVFYFNINLNTQTKVAGDIIVPEFLNDDYKLLITNLRQKPAGLYDNKGVMLATFGDINVDDKIIYGKGNAPEREKIISSVIEEEYPDTTFVRLPETTKKIKGGGLDIKDVEYVYVPDDVEEIDDNAFGDNLIYVSIPKARRIGKSQIPQFINGKEVKKITIDLENGDADITLTKGYIYMIEALYNFKDDVTGESTISLSNSDVVEYLPVYYLDAKETGDCVISGKYNAISGVKQTQVKIKVVDGASKRSSNSVCAGLYDNENNLIKSWDELISMGLSLKYDNYEIFNQIGGKIVLPNDVSDISGRALSHKNITSIEVLADNPNYMSVDGVLYSKDGKRLICYPSGKTDESYTVLDSAEIIEEYAFYGSKFLKTISLSNITEIGERAICSSGITSLIIPDTTTYVSKRAFFDCYNLQTVIIGQNVTNIGYAVFDCCTSLKTVTFKNTNNWYVKSDSSMNGSKITVTNASTNAKNFVDKYATTIMKDRNTNLTSERSVQYKWYRE